jgi:hypothetical protein
MKSALPRGSRRLGLPVLRLMVLTLAGLFLFLLASPVRAMSPESPEVVALVEKACGYLEKHIVDEGRPGAKALVGLTFLKAHKSGHPAVRIALAACQQHLAQGVIQGDVYTVALMLVFLCELPENERQHHANLIDRLVDHLHKIQKPHGGWGYPHFETGDTSMTQFAVLALWSADEAGHATPLECWDKVGNWAIRTQAPDGAYGYQGHDPGNDTPVDQMRTHESICAAGSGILYMCADKFGLLTDGPAEEPEDALLKKAKKPHADRKGNEAHQVDGDLLWKRITNADRHMDASYTIHPTIHPNYYLYALERYKTMRAAAEGNLDEPAVWYDEGVELLASLQAADGHWAAWHAEVGDVCDTCFATLFLLRSMKQRIINRLPGGVAAGGRLNLGPKERTKLTLPDFEWHLEAIASGRIVDLSAFDLKGDETDQDEFRERLRALLADAKSPEAKRIVLRKLAELHNLADVPVLIEALRDPNPAVHCAANEALRFLSRKFSAPGLDENDDDATRKAVIAYWEKWRESLASEE